MFISLFYIATVVMLFVSFLLVKKSDSKLNFVSMCILSAITYLAYNIAICMIFGSLNITTNLIFLSVTNIVVAVLFVIVIVRKKEIQSFEFRIKDFVAIFICLLIVAYMSKSQYRTFDLTVANGSVDASMHYSAATNFADNMKILAKIDNQTGYNFKTMQTGAYINTGIFMNIIRNLRPAYKEYVTFKIFEIGILLLNVVAFYMLISRKLVKKFDYCIGMIFVVLYAFAYPYTSLLYGFSYLSVAISFATGLFYVASLYMAEHVEEIKDTSQKAGSFHVVKESNDSQNSTLGFIWSLSFIVLLCVGIIYSYCLFVPALYAFICIYIWLQDLRDKEVKKYLKIFSRNTLIVTGLLLVVTGLSILYLVVPTFTDSDQNRLTDAIGFDGGIYKALFIDFLFYVPFVILFIVNSFKNKKISYQTIVFLMMLVQTVVTFVGVLYGIVSAYYFYKIYYIMWIIVVDIAVEVFADLGDNKDLRVVLSSALCIWCAIIYMGISGKEFKIQEKAPTLFDVAKSPSLAGIYYDTNVLATANINVSCLVNSDRLALAEEMGKQNDMTLKNMLVGGMNTNCKAWMYVVAKIKSGGESINDLQKAVVETNVDDFMADKTKIYFVVYTDTKYNDTEDYKVIFQNDAGAILKKSK